MARSKKKEVLDVNGMKVYIDYSSQDPEVSFADIGSSVTIESGSKDAFLNELEALIDKHKK